MYIEDGEESSEEELKEDLGVDEDDDIDVHKETRETNGNTSGQPEATPTPTAVKENKSSRVNEHVSTNPLAAEISTIRLSPDETLVIDITPSGVRCYAGSLTVHVEYCIGPSPFVLARGQQTRQARAATRHRAAQLRGWIRDHKFKSI